MVNRVTAAAAAELIARGGANFPSDQPIKVSYLSNVNRGYSDWDDAQIDTFQKFGAQQRESLRLALDLWSDVSGYTFTFVQANQPSDIRVGIIDLAPGVGGIAIPSQFGGPVDVWVDLEQASFIYRRADERPEFSILLHEVGHALGLSHPGGYNAPGDFTFEDDAAHARDTKRFTVMSYFGGDADTPMIDDLAAVRILSGIEPTTRAGNNTYGYNVSGTGMRDVFDFSKNPDPVVTIYDSGGVDRLDLLNIVGQRYENRVVLVPGEYSSVNGREDNLAIAPGTLIEEVRGGLLNDILVSNGTRTTFLYSPGEDRYIGLERSVDLLSFDNSTESLRSGIELQFTSEKSGYVVTTDLWGGFDQTFSQIEIVLGSNLDDVMVGNVGAQRIFGREGDDILGGGAGADLLYGDSGFDWVDYSDSPQAVRIDLPSRSFSGGDANGDVVFGVEGFRGTRFDDVLLAAPGAGADEIRFEGGAGADMMVGGSGLEMASYANAPGVVNVNLTTNRHTGAHATGDQLVRIDGVEGSRFGDTITGDNRGNVFDGGEGNDVIRGRAGRDLFYLGAGNDTVYGGADPDVVVYRGLDSTDVRPEFSGSGFRIVGPHGIDTIRGVESIRFGDGQDLDLRRFTGEYWEDLLRYSPVNPFDDLLRPFGIFDDLTFL